MEAQVAQAFDCARAAGMELIVSAPTDELLPLIESKVKEHDFAVAIHNHGPDDKYFPTPESIYEKVKGLDKRMGLCIDIGHTVRTGADLIASTPKYADRLLDLPMKARHCGSAAAEQRRPGWPRRDQHPQALTHIRAS